MGSPAANRLSATDKLCDQSLSVSLSRALCCSTVTRSRAARARSAFQSALQRDRATQPPEGSEERPQHRVRVLPHHRALQEV